jgi:hypothetical protein
MKRFFRLFQCCQPRTQEKNEEELVLDTGNAKTKIDIMTEYKIDIDIDENIKRSRSNKEVTRESLIVIEEESNQGNQLSEGIENGNNHDDNDRILIEDRLIRDDEKPHLIS